MAFRTQVLTVVGTKMSAALLICLAFGAALGEVDHFPTKLMFSLLGKEELP